MIVAVITVIILINQYRFKKYEWRFTLFDKRYAVYKSAIGFISGIVTWHYYDFLDAAESRQFHLSEYVAFTSATIDTKLLFGDDAHELIKSVSQKAWDSIRYETRISKESDKAQKEQLIRERKVIIDEINATYDTAISIFEKYLKLDKLA